MARRDRGQRTAESDEGDINLTPMLDIVFIMLIFFIVTATFVKQSGVEVAKPEAATAERKDQASILIGITKEDEIWINRRQVELDSLKSNIEQLHAENPRGTVVVQADKQAKAGLLMSVTEAVNQTGVPSVAVSTEKD